MKMTMTHLYWMADALKMELTAGQKVSGQAKLKVPTFDKIRLVCPVEVRGSMYASKKEESSLLVHIRGYLYIVLGYDGDNGYLWVVDGKTTNTVGFFRGMSSLDAIEKKLGATAVKRYIFDPVKKLWRERAKNMG